MRYLTADDIVYIHDKIVEEIGGSLGIREFGLLESIVNKPNSGFGGQDLYPTVFDKAATLYEALCNYHVFIDGNKRTAALVAYRFLSINGHELTASNKQLQDYTLYIATHNPDLADVAAWIKKHSKKVVSRQ